MDEDSIDLHHAQTKYGRGYITELAVDQARRKNLDSREAHFHLLSEQKRVQSKFAIDIQKLRNDVAQLRSREKAAARQSGIFSTATGIVHDIRQIYHNNKLQVTFVIRRIGKQE